MVVVMALVGIAIGAALGAVVLWLVGSKVFNMEGVNYGNSFLSVFVAGVVGWLINWLSLSAGITFLVAPFGYSMVGMLVWGILWGTVILTPCCKQFWGCEMADAAKASLVYNIVWVILWTFVLAGILAGIGLSM